MKRILLIAALCLFGSLPAKATTYYIDLSTIAPAGYYFGPCYCGGGPMFPAMAANPGDVFDFGSVTLKQVFDDHTAFHNRWYDQGTMQWITPWLVYIPEVAVSFDPSRPVYPTGGVRYYSGLDPTPTLKR